MITDHCANPTLKKKMHDRQESFVREGMKWKQHIVTI
jgi:hypothetical protein